MIFAALLFALQQSQLPTASSEALVQVEFRLLSGPDGALRVVNVESEEAKSVSMERGKGSVRLPAGSRWEISSGSDGWWTPPETLFIPQSSEPVIIERRTWKTGAVSGKVRLADKQSPMPSTIRVAVEGVPASRTEDGLPKNTTVECPVAKDGSWTCHVPAGQRDLAVRADRFIPAYRWDRNVVAGARLDLGEVLLRRGASVSGWVAAEEDRADLAKARVSLTRLVAPGTSGAMQERLTRPVTAASVRADGFFQLTGMPAGSYRLVIDHDTFARNTLFPIEVFEESETAIRAPLLLRKPASLRLYVEPMNHPSGAPWFLSVSRMADYGSSADGPPVFEGEADPAGTVVKDLSPGTFRVTVSDADENRLLRKTIEVASAIETAETLRLSFVHVEGEVKARAKPVVAELWFGGEHGSVRVRARSDEAGKFETLLPHDGQWLVEIRSESQATTTAKQVDVSGGTDHSARVTIELSASTVTGRVVDEKRQPVAHAHVSLHGAKQSLATRTGSDGTFTFEAVESGSVEIVASASVSGIMRQSDFATVQITEEADSGPIELRLHTTRRIAGRVVSQRGPVAGASLTVARFAGGAVTVTTTDVDGSWSADLPSIDRSAIVTVSPPGHAFRAFEIPLVAEPIVLHVPETGGTLIVRPREGEGYVIRQDDKVLPFGDLMRWAIGHGVRFDAQPGVRRFPELSAAVYTVCGMVSGRCRSATLAPGGVVEIDLNEDL